MKHYYGWNALMRLLNLQDHNRFCGNTHVQLRTRQLVTTKRSRFDGVTTIERVHRVNRRRREHLSCDVLDRSTCECRTDLRCSRWIEVDNGQMQAAFAIAREAA